MQFLFQILKRPFFLFFVSLPPGSVFLNLFFSLSSSHADAMDPPYVPERDENSLLFSFKTNLPFPRPTTNVIFLPPASKLGFSSSCSIRSSHYRNIDKFLMPPWAPLFPSPGTFPVPSTEQLNQFVSLFPLINTVRKCVLSNSLLSSVRPIFTFVPRQTSSAKVLHKPPFFP